ncbi:TetR family transcriptional regulator [Mycobacterium hodleri]|uniref:TetR family transcriptional regulator n=1 Tax=Mycolicibacterium hodleri TaxID=49897 RepID=UPI0021F2B70F|nr:TetR family transcriptional regulator [Mycolicibacterium hodleri]MCV7135857.1 TetR family transcriptional regulator [Mycolicibacterium hodleri]
MNGSRTEEFMQYLSALDADAIAHLEQPDDLTARILDATREQAMEVGFRRITMDDVARRSGLGRATLYRRFPNKAALIDALVLTEARRYLAGDAEAWARGTTLEDRMFRSTMFGVTFLRDNELLHKLMRTEPDALLRSLTVDAGPILDFAAEQTVTLLRTALHGDSHISAAQQRHLRTVAELQTRLTLSFIVTPHTSIELTTPAEVRAYVRQYLLPMITTPPARG